MQRKQIKKYFWLFFFFFLLFFFPISQNEGALRCHGVFTLTNQSLNTSNGAGESHKEESAKSQPEVVKQVSEPSRGNATFSSEELVELLGKEKDRKKKKEMRESVVQVPAPHSFQMTVSHQNVHQVPYYLVRKGGKKEKKFLRQTFSPFQNYVCCPLRSDSANGPGSASCLWKGGCLDRSETFFFCLFLFVCF